MTRGPFGLVTMTIAMLMLAGSLSACGRKGNLEAPPSAQIVTDENAQQQAEPEKPDNPFFLDPLI